MFRLAALGGLSLGNSEAADVAIPRRRLALLALLAVAGDRGLSRDKLVALFWPDSSAEYARHSLEQLLYSLRHQLHPGLFRGTDPISLNPEVVTSDVTAFEQALARGADHEAADVYAGDFLDGFYLSRSAEFERWVDEQRVRLRSAYAGAVQRIAEDAARRRDWSSAVAAWRRLVALDRLSSSSTLGLVRALVAAGDHAEALRTATAFEALVRGELGVPLDPSFERFLQTVRESRPNASAMAPARRRAAEPTPNRTTTDAATVAGAPVAGAPVAGESEVTAPHPRARRRGLAAALLIAVPILAVLVWPVSPSRGTSRPGVAVEVFKNWTGDSTLDYVGPMTAEYTRDALARTEIVDVSDPSFDIWDSRNARPDRPSAIAALVRLTKPKIVISGAYFGKRGSLTFTGKAVDTRSGTILFAFDSVSGDELPDAVDRVRQRVMSGVGTKVDPRLTAWAGNQGRPPMKFAAYLEFAAGMTAFVDGNGRRISGRAAAGAFDSARIHLENAFRLDSTYAPAGLWLFWAHSNVGDRAAADSILSILAPHESAMTPYERTLYRYEAALMRGTPDERFRLDSALVKYAPASEYRYCMGRDAVQAGHPREALEVLGSLDETYAWMRFMPPEPGFRVRAYVQLDEYERAIGAARQAHTASPHDITSSFPEIDALAALGRVAEIHTVVDQAIARTDSLDPRVLNLMLYAGLRLETAGQPQPARQLFARALNLFARAPAGDAALFARARSLYYLERWDEAHEAFTQLIGSSSGRTPYDWQAAIFLGSMAARRGDAAEVARIRDRLHGLTVAPAEEEYFEARVAAARGETDNALRFLADAVKQGAQVWKVMEEGGAIPSMDPDFARLRGSPEFRKAVGFW